MSKSPNGHLKDQNPVNPILGEDFVETKLLKTLLSSFFLELYKIFERNLQTMTVYLGKKQSDKTPGKVSYSQGSSNTWEMLKEKCLDGKLGKYSH